MKLDLKDYKNLAVGSGVVSLAMLLGFVQIGWMIIAMFAIYCLMMYKRLEAQTLQANKKVKK